MNTVVATAAAILARSSVNGRWLVSLICWERVLARLPVWSA
ncbi:hypothetical protein ACVXG9_11390 [Escherichia coli]